MAQSGRLSASLLGAEGSRHSPGLGPPRSNHSGLQVKQEEGATTEPGNPHTCTHTTYHTLMDMMGPWGPKEENCWARTPESFWPQGLGVSHGPEVTGLALHPELGSRSWSICAGDWRPHATSWSSGAQKAGQAEVQITRDTPLNAEVGQWHSDLRYFSGKHCSVQRCQNGAASAHECRPRRP